MGSTYGDLRNTLESCLKGVVIAVVVLVGCQQDTAIRLNRGSNQTWVRMELLDSMPGTSVLAGHWAQTVRASSPIVNTTKFFIY